MRVVIIKQNQSILQALAGKRPLSIVGETENTLTLSMSAERLQKIKTALRQKGYNPFNFLGIL